MSLGSKFLLSLGFVEYKGSKVKAPHVLCYFSDHYATNTYTTASDNLVSGAEIVRHSQREWYYNSRLCFEINRQFWLSTELC
jgi:hypothetical protein